MFYVTIVVINITAMSLTRPSQTFSTLDHLMRFLAWSQVNFNNVISIIFLVKNISDLPPWFPIGLRLRRYQVLWKFVGIAPNFHPPPYIYFRNSALAISFSFIYLKTIIKSYQISVEIWKSWPSGLVQGLDKSKEHFS